MAIAIETAIHKPYGVSAGQLLLKKKGARVRAPPMTSMEVRYGRRQSRAPKMRSMERPLAFAIHEVACPMEPKMMLQSNESASMGEA